VDEGCIERAVAQRALPAQGRVRRRARTIAPPSRLRDETTRVALKKIREINSHTRHLSRWRCSAPRNPLTVGHCGNPVD
jgi:hypothetical protein